MALERQIDLSGPPLVQLITRRSRVRIPPPLLKKGPLIRAFLLSETSLWARSGQGADGSANAEGLGPWYVEPLGAPPLTGRYVYFTTTTVRRPSYADAAGWTSSTSGS
jgi:hypothetical protein